MLNGRWLQEGARLRVRVCLRECVCGLKAGEGSVVIESEDAELKGDDGC